VSAVSSPTAVAERNLAAIASLDVPVPGYDRSALRPRILHIGVGGFHRAHMAVYTDESAVTGGNWGIKGAGLLQADRRMAQVLAAQDHLYTVIERDSDSSYPSIVGSIVDFAFVAGDDDGLNQQVADPDIAIVSLTITEGGYSVKTPNPTIEAIVSALDARRRAGGRPVTILSCDNLPGNGDVARHAVTTVADARGADLARYVDAACTFPNSMVDRITPQTTDADRAWLRERGVDDGWPVVCESFRQWVIEDTFAAGRPRWEDVGVLFSDRVHDWELYKLRMLNASHSCMAYLSALAGVVYVDEAIAIPEVARYLGRLLATEAIPTLREIPEHPPADYAESVFHRLANTGVRDQIARLCIDGTAKFPSFLLPTIEAQLDREGPIACAALALAGWARYLATVPDAKRAPDPHGDEAAALARSALTDPVAFLELSIFGERIRTSNQFRNAFDSASRQLAELGPLGAIAVLLNRDHTQLWHQARRPTW
jgi:mannitol 2-dehydrogenase